MSQNKHTVDDLYQMQALPLESKIQMTKYRILQWYDKFDGNIYISFSGGKDSTVLVDIVRRFCGLDNVPLVFVDTGLEYPEIREFVKGYGDSVVWLKPKKNFKQVIMENGYPFITKEISNSVDLAQRGFKSGMDRLNGVDRFGNESSFRKSFKKWKTLVDSPYKFSSYCCDINKKAPVKSYEHKSKRKGVLATLASESALRKTAWLRTGCNAYDSDRPLSKPMSFWTEQDVLQYIKKYEIPIASVYGKVVYKDDDNMEYDFPMFNSDMKLTTTGCERTGCIYCGYGCHLKQDDRFVRLKTTHPQIYDWVMKPINSGGLGYKEVIDWLNKNMNLKIRY